MKISLHRFRDKWTCFGSICTLSLWWVSFKNNKEIYFCQVVVKILWRPLLLWYFMKGMELWQLKPEKRGTGQCLLSWETESRARREQKGDDMSSIYLFQIDDIFREIKITIHVRQCLFKRFIDYGTFYSSSTKGNNFSDYNSVLRTLLYWKYELVIKC